MITLTIEKQVKKGSIIKYERELKVFNSVDKCRKEVIPIVAEMKQAKKAKRPAKIAIRGVSYDYDSEKSMLLETKAIVTTKNESEEDY